MDPLPRKVRFKQDSKSNLTRYRPSTLKKYPSKLTLVPEKPPTIYVVPRMPTEKEINENAVVYEIICAFCNGPCIDDYIHCHVCIKTYHSQCLYGPDDIDNPLILLPHLEKHDRSCPECEDLTRLLTQDEMNYLIHAFQQIDQDKDGFINMKGFLVLCSKGKMIDGFNAFPPSNLDFEKVHFSLMDSSQKDDVAWSDFLRFYSCKLIAGKNKTQLTTELSKKELVFAKRLFLKDPCLKIDNKRNVIITKDYFNQVFHNLILTIKKKYGGHYIDAILHENQNIDETIEELSGICWDEYLRQISIPIILNRSNYAVKSRHLCRGSITDHPPETIVDSSYIDLMKNVTTTSVITGSLDLSFNKSFRKYGKILKKLHRQEEFERKQMRSLVNWSIMENIEEEGKFEVPKLKPNARDERQTISEPWSVVKDMENLRNEPILITTTHIQMFKY